MAEFAEILLLAALPGDDGHVYIGLRLDGSHRFMRIVGPSDDFSVLPEHARLDVGRLPQPLDVVRVGLKQRKPLPLQPENWLVDRSLRWHLMRQISARDFKELSACTLHGSAALYALDRASTLPEPGESIWLMGPSDAGFCVQECADAECLECSVRVDFGVSRRMISIVDEACLDRLVEAGCGTHRPDEVGYAGGSRLLLVVTVGDYVDDDGSMEPFVVAVLEQRESGKRASLAVQQVASPSTDQRAHQPESPPVVSVRQKSPPMEWSDEQTVELRRLWEDGETVERLAARFRCRHLAILTRLWKLGYDPREDRSGEQPQNGDRRPDDVAPHEEGNPSSRCPVLQIDLSGLPDASEGVLFTPAVAEARETHPRAYDPWTAAEDAELLRLADGGAEHIAISRALQRQPSAVIARLRHLEGTLRSSRSEQGRSPDTLSKRHQIDATAAADRLSARLGRGVGEAPLARFARRLDPHQRDVLDLRYGMDHHEPMSVSAVAQALALTEERVGEIEERLLDALRGYLDGWEWAVCESGVQDHRSEA